MRKFVKKAAAALLAGTMAMSLAACAGFTPRLLRNQERRKP